jgi:hypothetical protein
MSEPVLFVAVHAGPHQTLAALEPAMQAQAAVTYVVEGIAKEERRRRALPYVDLETIKERFGDLDAFLQQRHAQAIVCGTSDMPSEQNVERLMALAAARADVPVFAIEDFPGNYRPEPGERLDGLFVEDDATKSLHVHRGINAARIHVTGNPRYAALGRIDAVGRRREARRRLAIGQEDPVILWIGQPDGEGSHETFRRILKPLRAKPRAILFRAHPRDPWYREGRYQELLNGSAGAIRDVSAEPDALELCCGADLVVTQFSSTGLEALYLGVPTVFALFDDLGKRYLARHKGYELPPWCLEEPVFLIERQEEASPVLEQALHDEGRRRAVCERFAKRLAASADSSRMILAVMRDAMSRLEAQPQTR